MPAPATASMPSTTTSTMRPAPTAAKDELAQRAITPTAASPDPEAALVSPSLQAIWQSFKEHGHGDTELLKLILSAKLKEDERLKSMDDLRAEQLRAQQAMWQYTMYQYMLVASAQQQQAAAAAAAAVKGGPAPYSPLSPPPAELVPLSNNGTTSNKRPRASSSASSASSTSDAAKKARTGTHSPPRTTALAPGQKPSHADVMDALRRKCEANKQTQQPTAAAAALSAARTSPSYPHRALAPAPTSSARTSMSPPLSTTATPGSTARRLSPPHVVPGRHTSFLRPAPPPSDASSSASQQHASAPRPSSPPALASVREHPTAEPAQALPRSNKLALLLHASESTASHFHTPSWLPQPQQATSDVRGSFVPAPAVVAAADA
ncbi:hypothetical protein JCM3775_003191 [Rhodotorula graminis]